ncbi:MAG: hypothetical protein U0414_01015 [Polyangiaceae bacterium]
MSDADFALVEDGSLLPSPCSPPIEDDDAFLGIRIAAPSRVRLENGGQRPSVMICGGYHLPLHYAGLGTSLERGVWIVASDLRQERVLVGPAVAELGERAEDELPRTGGPSSGVTVIEYFNRDIGPQIVAEPGTWFVYAMIGEAVSNVVRIELGSEE